MAPTSVRVNRAGKPLRSAPLALMLNFDLTKSRLNDARLSCELARSNSGSARWTGFSGHVAAQAVPYPDAGRMTYGFDAYHDDFADHGHQRSPRKNVVAGLFCAVGLALTIVTGGWSVCAYLSGPATEPDTSSELSEADTSDEGVDSELSTALFDPAFSGFSAGTISQNPPLAAGRFQSFAAAAPQSDPSADEDGLAAPPLPPNRRIALSVPFPAPRPSGSSQAASVPPQPAALGSKITSLPQDGWALVENLFGKLKEAGPKLAYAPSDGGIFSDRSGITADRPAGLDRSTAVYDISARTVYMPDGTKLEAHSGLGSRLDDPRFVHEKMRGPTPPHVYDLKMREQPFHGVRALRLIPVGGNPHGRTGLLAHTFMLGPNGDSNGCVSFRNYDAFLQAYLAGKVDRLVVVASRD